VEAFGQNYKQDKLRIILRDLISAGIDTTKGTMSWSIVYLANHPEWQKRLREQVSHVIVFRVSKTSHFSQFSEEKQ
jgi:cytochrome P450